MKNSLIQLHVCGWKLPLKGIDVQSLSEMFPIVAVLTQVSVAQSDHVQLVHKRSCQDNLPDVLDEKAHMV